MANRASGRVRKQPEVYASSPFTSSAKRKRNEDEVEDEEGDRAMPDDYVSDGTTGEEEDDEPDEEEIRAQKQAARKPKSTAPKKPAQKKPKVNGASLPFRNATGGSRKKAPRKAKPTATEGAAAVGGLYADVFASDATFEEVAGKWLTRFDEHESAALAEIVTFVLRCAGCEGQVYETDIEDPDGATNKLDDLRDEYQASKPTDYPLIAKGKAAASFKQGIVGFFHALVKAMAVKGTMYDNAILMENVQIWISTMSSAPNRSFRHTATVASLSILTALCEVARENAEAIATKQRHAEAERKKSKNKDRVKQIEGTVKANTTQLETVEPMLKDWFDVVFIHRYRDVDPIIRRDCVAALGDWIVTMPDVFFDGQHLRYLGWVLSDTASPTRGEVVKQLHRLYKHKDMIGGLKTFTEKFRPRLVELATTDAETSVRVSGVELLDLLRENELLEPDDIDAVGRMIFDTDLRVRKCVAAFFSENVNDLYNSKIDDLGGFESLEEALPEIGEDNYEAPRLEWLKFKSLAEMLLSYDTDESLPNQIERSRGDGGLTLHLGASDSRFTLAAEVLYDKIDDIKEWQMLAGYLLFDHSGGRANGVATDSLSQLKHESVLQEKEEAVLLEVLNASVKHTLTEIAQKLQQPKTKLTSKQKDRLEEEQEDAARHLANVIPGLLKKFGDVPSTAAAVLRIEAVLSLPSLRTLQQDSATCTALLDDIRKQFMSHGTDEVLAPASNAILHAKSYGELDDLTEEKVTALWEDVVTNLTELLNPDTVIVRGASEYEELTALSNNLLRIVRLASVSDCIPPLEDSSAAAQDEATGADYQGAIDYIIALGLRAAPSSGPAPDADDGAVEDEIAARAAQAALFYFQWKIKSIVEAVTSNTSTGVPLEELEVLATRRDTYVDNLKSVLDARKAGEEVSVSLAGSLLDLYSCAAILRDVKAKPGMSDDYTILAMDLAPEYEKSIMQVFAASEKGFAKLSGKKLEEAHVDAGADADDVNEDPMSDPESDDEDEETQTQTQTQGQSQAFQQRKETKMLNTLLAEQKLCALTGKIIRALIAGVMDVAAVSQRIERNKARLGPNFKEVLAYLDFDKMQQKSNAKSKAKAKSRAKAKPAAVNGAKAKADPKSNAIVAADDMEDDIEDVDADDDEALRRRELVDDMELEPEQEVEEGVANGAQAEEESVIGD